MKARPAPAAAVVLLVAGFLPWWHLTIEDQVSQRFTAWDVSPAWWLPVLAGIVAGGLWLVPGTERWRAPVTALVGGVGAALVVGRWLTLPVGGAGTGWFSYAPLDAEVSLHGEVQAGLWLALAGLVALLVVGVSETWRQRAAVQDVQPLGRPGDRDVEVVDPAE